MAVKDTVKTSYLVAPRALRLEGKIFSASKLPHDTYIRDNSNLMVFTASDNSQGGDENNSNENNRSPLNKGKGIATEDDYISSDNEDETLNLNLDLNSAKAAKVKAEAEAAKAEYLATKAEKEAAEGKPEYLTLKNKSLAAYVKYKTAEATADYTFIYGNRNKYKTVLAEAEKTEVDSMNRTDESDDDQ